MRGRTRWIASVLFGVGYGLLWGFALEDVAVGLFAGIMGLMYALVIIFPIREVEK